MNHTLQEIFKIIEEREWSWFSEPKKDWKIRQFHIAREMADGEVYRSFSIADLLASHSWCKAVWGEEGVTECCGDRNYDGEDGCCACGTCDIKFADEIASFKYHSLNAFQILQQESQQACLNFIYETMKK